MNKAEELLENIEEYQAEAWEKRYDRSNGEQDVMKMVECIHDFPLSKTVKVSLSYSKPPGEPGWICTFSVGHGTSDSWKPTLLMIAQALAGQDAPPSPNVGKFCTLFQFRVADPDVDLSELN